MNGSESSVNGSDPFVSDPLERSAASPASGSRFTRSVGQFFVQLRILLWKNIILFLRNWKGTLGQLIAPIIVVLLLLGFQALGEWVLNRTDPHPVGVSYASSLPKCILGPGQTECITMRYSPGNVTWVENLMRRVAYRSGLSFETDFATMEFAKVDIGQNLTDILNETVYEYFREHQNETQNAVIFTGALMQSLISPHQNTTYPPNQLGYVVFFNSTAENTLVPEVIKMVEQEIIALKANISLANDTLPTINMTHTRWPQPKQRVAGLDAVGLFGATWFFLPPMITFFILLVEIVGEKEKRLRIGMRMMGLSNAVYWIVWFITGTLFITLISLLLFLAGFACRFPFFVNSNFFATFLLFWMFGMSMLCVCFFCSTLFSSTRTAQTAGYAIILVGFVFQSILSSAEGRLADMLWAPDVPDWVVLIKWILTFYPPFNFSKAFSDFARRSSATLDVAAGLVKEGSGMHWEDLYKNETMNFPAFQVYVNVPAPIEAMSWMIMNAAFFVLLAWYCDNVVSGDHGSPRPFYFFFTPEYWGCGRKKRSVSSDSSPAALGDDGYDSDVAREAAATEASKNSAETPAVRLVRLTKEYRKYALCKAKTDTKAVDNLSLTINQNEIFCLLGHNGAGKTTTINILTGLFPASSGDAEIAGLDIVDHMDEIREQLGVCPQHDILWPELTAREHLQLFAQLKGIPSFLIDREVHEKIVQVGLEDAADNPTGSFSGGMKRRLSVAISCIGNPKIVFMDEPTTGLDPVNKRAVWHLIQSMKKDRCVILTTHSMEEADVLSDRIAIMAFGKLRCIGNGLHLKSKYGSGYRISLLTEQAHTQTVISAIEEKFPGLTSLSANDAGAIAFNVSQKKLNQVPELIAFIDQLRAQTKDGHEMIHEWGVSHSTLEEVFLAITKKHHFVYDDIDPDLDNNDDGTTDTTVVPGMPTANSGTPSTSSQPTVGKEKSVDSDDEDYQDTKPLLASAASVNTKAEPRYSANNPKRPKQKHPPSHPFRALFRKNLSLQARQKFTNVCQIITPVLVIVILVILRKIIQVKVGDTTITEFVPTVPFPLNSQGYQMPSVSPGSPARSKNTHELPPWKALADSIDFDDLYDKAEELLRSGAKLYRPNAPLGDTISVGLDNVIWFHYSEPESSPGSAGFLLPNGTKSGMLGVIPQHKVADRVNGTLTNMTRNPYFIQLGSEYDIQSAIYAVENTYGNTSIAKVNQPPYILMMPDGYASFYTIDTASAQINFSLSVNDLPYRNYHRLNNFTKIAFVGQRGFRLKDPLVRPDLGQYQLVQMISRAFTKWVLWDTFGVNITDTATNIPPEWRTFLDLTWVWPMPYYGSQDIWALLEAFGVILYPVALTLQLPIYIYILVLEKFEKLREMMLSHGMQLWHYNLTNYVFFATLYTFIGAFFWVSGIGFSMRFFTDTHWSTLLVWFIGWGLAVISLAFFLSSLINSPRASTIVGYATALLGSMIGIIVAVGIYGPTPFAVARRVPTWLLMWPQFSFVRALFLMNDACAEKHLCVGPVWKLPFDDELTACFIALFVSAVVYFILFLYLDAVLPRQYGVPKHPLFVFFAIVDCFGACCKKRPSSDSLRRLQSQDPASEAEESEARMLLREDDDVALERRKVHLQQYDLPVTPLVLHDLRKVYDEASPPKVAVKSLCLTVSEGECFGLLGENGAGKSTTISMLTGLFPPTSGSALVAGYDIATEIEQVHLSMGLCPQFDVLWSDLSVREHLLFYCRLKGVDTSHESDHVKRIMRDVGLHTAGEKLASDLSGGMKRRLSIAIAMVGHSRIVLLDEPTTGLDPVSRRQIWAIVHRAKRGRAIVLTTHSMEEAELLCSRIGIMAKGSMRCLGNQQHLKNRYGGGYTMKVNFNPTDERSVSAFISSAFPGASISGDFRGTKEIRLDVSANVGDVFLAMESQSRKAGVIDYSISQVGLEDVFQRIVEESKRGDE